MLYINEVLVEEHAEHESMGAFCFTKRLKFPLLIMGNYRRF